MIPENARRLHIADDNNEQQAGTTSTPARLFDSNHQAIRTITSNYDRRQPIIASPANHSSLTIDVDASISHSRAQPSRTTRYSSSTTTSHTLSCPWRRLTSWHAMELSDVAAPILCSHALHGKESVMACKSRLFRFHGTYLLASHAVNSSLLTSRCRRKSSHQVFKTFLSGFSSKRSDRHRCLRPSWCQHQQRWCASTCIVGRLLLPREKAPS